MTAHPELEGCLQSLVDLANRQDRSWSEVLDRVLRAKIAINQVLGAGNVYSREINRILCDLCLRDRASIDAAAVLSLVDWVRAAIRWQDSSFGKMLCDLAGPRRQYANT